MESLIAEYRVDGIMLWDDLFAVNKRRLNELAELIEVRRLNKRVELAVFARANLVDEETVALLQRMNVTSVLFGFESGSDPVLRYLKKGSVSVENNYRALRLCKKAGMRTFSTFIIGSPEETREDIVLTRKMTRDPDLDEALVCHLKPLPGTEVWEYAKGLGLVHDGIDWDYASLRHWGFDPNIVVAKHLSVEELGQIYREMSEECEGRMYRAGMSAIRLKYLFDLRVAKKVLRRWPEYARYVKARLGLGKV